MLSHAMRRTTAALALLVAPLVGCGDSTDAGSGRVSIRLTDAPGDVKAAVVTISQVYLQGGAEENAGRVVLSDEARTVDLVTLVNRTTDLVDGAVVPAGTYAQLRFVITGGYIEVENADGSTSIYASSPSYAGLPAGATVAGQLRMPSYAQSGLKVQLPGGAVRVSGEQRILLVDFDVAQSFAKGPNGSGAWVMSPVVKGADLGLSSGVTATLRLGEGVTLPEVGGSATMLAQFKATLRSADASPDALSGEELALTDADNDGVYEARFGFVVPGSYTIDFAAPAGVTFATDQALPQMVSVTSGAQATAAFTVTQAGTAAP